MLPHLAPSCCCRVSPEEQRIIELVPQPPAAIILLGRIGTGRCQAFRADVCFAAQPALGLAPPACMPATLPTCVALACPSLQARPPAPCSACGADGWRRGSRAPPTTRSSSRSRPRCRTRRVPWGAAAAAAAAAPRLLTSSSAGSRVHLLLDISCACEPVEHLPNRSAMRRFAALALICIISSVSFDLCRLICVV